MLYLASGSIYRAKMLKDAEIPFILHKHFSKEEQVIDYKGNSPLEFVTKIAKDKMANVILPDQAREFEKIFVLVADTLVFTKDRQYLAKPKDKQDALRMLKLVSKGPIDVVSVAVLEKKVFVDDQYKTVESLVLHEPTEVFWQIPESQIDFYIKHQPNYLNLSSAAHIEEIGAQYLKWIKGCYWSTIGLPIFAVREALEKFGYLSKERL